jgi:hypothetical protein
VALNIFLLERDTLFLTLREEHRLFVFKQRAQESKGCDIWIIIKKEISLFSFQTLCTLSNFVMKEILAEYIETFCDRSRARKFTCYNKGSVNKKFPLYSLCR